MSEQRIGIDIGGVIIAKENDDTDTSLFGPNYLKAAPVHGAIAAVARINKEIFPGNAFIVSKCGENIERKSREWLKAHDFEQLTGIPEGRLHFCRERSEKAPIARKLGLTHFIDDKLEVLSYMNGIVRNRIAFHPYPSEMKRWILSVGPTILTFSWADVLEWLAPQSVSNHMGKILKDLQDFFCTRQEFEQARAIVDLGDVISGKSDSVKPFMTLNGLSVDLFKDGCGPQATWLIDVLDYAREVVEKKAVR